MNALIREVADDHTHAKQSLSVVSDSIFSHVDTNTRIAANESFFNIGTFEVKEITSLKEKRMWMERFAKEYSGRLIGLEPVMFGQYCRYFVGILNSKEAGYIRIVDYTEMWSKYYDGQVWNASDAFVKKAYRNQSVLRRLLLHVINNCNVKAVRLETARLQSNARYYGSLGFSYAWSIGDGDLSIAVLQELESAAKVRNDDPDD